MRSSAFRVLRPLTVLAAALLLAACATTGSTTRSGPSNPTDPWENWNRKVFAFNEGLDEAVLKPVATTYNKVVPRPVRLGVDNFFGNFADAWSAVNNFLQGKFGEGMHDVVRVGTNTFFGFFGVLDIASEFGLDSQHEDFGQTLGRWGVGAGPYVVWPLLGPSNVRESVALPLDMSVSPTVLAHTDPGRVAIASLGIVNARANLLGATRMLDDIALDKYTFVRDAYLQRRRSLVYDGDAPETPEPPEPASSAASAPGSAAASAAAPAPAASAASAPR
jgi:phospholipid-binding lipoprotein MlaA